MGWVDQWSRYGKASKPAVPSENLLRSYPLETKHLSIQTSKQLNV